MIAIIIAGDIFRSHSHSSELEEFQSLHCFAMRIDIKKKVLSAENISFSVWTLKLLSD